MHRGYIKLWRKNKTSLVWQMPPLYGRIWSWLLLSVNYEAKTIPSPTGPITVNPGQRITSYRQIAEEVAWYEYGILKTPNTKTIKTVLDWLESNGQCTAESNAKGTVITVTNWDTYNGHDSVEVTEKEQPEVTESKRGADTNKKVKKEPKKKEESKVKRFVPPSVEEVTVYCLERNNGIDANRWHDYYQSKGWIVGKTKMSDWKASVRTWETNNKRTNNDRSGNTSGSNQTGRKTGFIEANGAGTDFLS